MKMTSSTKHKQGFTAVELLITLFVAALFLTAGYTLYDAILGRSSEARQKAKADNVAYDYIRKYEASVSTPCVASTPQDRVALSGSEVDGLGNARVTVQVTCPYNPTNTRLSKISVKIEYGDGGNARSVQHEILASEQ